MFGFRKSKRKKELKNLYGIVQAEVEEFSNILYLLQEYKVKSVSEFIQKHPREAYINGIIWTYDARKKISQDESNALANTYFESEIQSVEEILNDIKEHHGDYEEAKRTMAGILNYCHKNKMA